MSDGVGLFQGEEGLAEELEEEEIVTLIDNMAEEFFPGEFGASPKDAETMRREPEEAAEEFEANQSSSNSNNTNNTDSSNNIINTNNTVSKSIINNNSGMDGISNGGAGSGGTCSSGNISSNISNGCGGGRSSCNNNNSSSSSDSASANLDEPQALLHDISPRPRQPSGHAQLPQEFNPTQLEEIKTRLLKIEEGKIKKEREEEERRKEAEEEEAAGGRKKRVRPSTASAVFRHQMAPPPENASKEEKKKYKQLMKAKQNRDKKKEEDEERKLLLKKAEVEKASRDALLCKCLGILVRHGLVGELENDSAGEGAAGPVPGGSGIRLLQVSRKVEVNFERAQLEDDDSSNDDCDGEAAIGRKRKMTAEAVGSNASVGAIARKSSYRAKKSRPT